MSRHRVKSKDKADEPHKELLRAYSYEAIIAELEPQDPNLSCDKCARNPQADNRLAYCSSCRKWYCGTECFSLHTSKTTIFVLARGEGA